mgnify:CR=1 FL=1
MIHQYLVQLTTPMQRCFQPGSAQFNTLAEHTKKLSAKREKWPEKIFSSWKTREVPVYSPESITKINQARISQMSMLMNKERDYKPLIKMI